MRERILLLVCSTALLLGCQPTTRLPSASPREPSPATLAPPTALARPSQPGDETQPSRPSRTATLPPPPTSATPAPAFAPTGPTQQAFVVRVVDGDTIRVLIDGQEHRLRYIGVDTPETLHPSEPVEWLGRQASEANRQLVDGQVVVLEKDVSEVDRYGRLLRYVWLEQDGEWLLVNLELVSLGFAQVVTYPPDVKYTALFLEAQREAREAERGLWGTPPATPDTDSPTDAGGASGSDGDCDPAYPGVCIPPSPPDLDCADITYRRFDVLPPDPHRFDGDDDDGIGCESG